MAVRVRVKIMVPDTDKEITSTALLNSGFETEAPQIILPVAVAERLGLHIIATDLIDCMPQIMKRFDRIEE